MRPLQSLLTLAIGAVLLAFGSMTRESVSPTVLAGEEDSPADQQPAPERRTRNGLQVLYDFRSIEGALIEDRSGH